MGRAALKGGLEMLDLATIHERAVVILAFSNDGAICQAASIRAAGAFFAQALIPLNTARRATRDSNEQLRQRNETMRTFLLAVCATNTLLNREIERRHAGECALRQGKADYRRLLEESRMMQEKLRSLARQMMSAQEDERREISRELHDEVVQTLVGINVELATLGKGASVGLKALKERILHTQRLVENSVNSVHRFARALRPAALDDLGLIPALHAYTTILAERRHLKIRMTAFAGVEALGPLKRTALFRVAQEALTNVARHANATRVRIAISQGPGIIRMDISDNGRSFDVRKVIQARSCHHLGLVGMRERIEMVHGTLSITSVRGKGTIVRAEVPSEPGKIAA
jgi:signal transduction histidine kinase